MVNTSKLCIILFLIFVVIYLIENYSTVEGLTIFDENKVKEQVNDMTSKFQNNKGFTTQNDEVNLTKDAVIKPPNLGSEGISVEDTPTTLDSDLIKQYSDQLASNLKTKDFNVKDFLPQEINSDWFSTDLSKAQNEVDQGTLIDISRFCQGVDTIGQSLKNPSYDIRGNIPNPKISISPFLNSSYEPDTNLKSWHTC